MNSVKKHSYHEVKVKLMFTIALLSFFTLLPLVSAWANTTFDYRREVNCGLVAGRTSITAENEFIELWLNSTNINNCTSNIRYYNASDTAELPIDILKDSTSTVSNSKCHIRLAINGSKDNSVCGYLYYDSAVNDISNVKGGLTYSFDTDLTVSNNKVEWIFAGNGKGLKSLKRLDGENNQLCANSICFGMIGNGCIGSWGCEGGTLSYDTKCLDSDCTLGIKVGFINTNNNAYMNYTVYDKDYADLNVNSTALFSLFGTFGTTAFGAGQISRYRQFDNSTSSYIADGGGYKSVANWWSHVDGNNAGSDTISIFWKQNETIADIWVGSNTINAYAYGSGQYGGYLFYNVTSSNYFGIPITKDEYKSSDCENCYTLNMRFKVGKDGGSNSAIDTAQFREWYKLLNPIELSLGSEQSTEVVSYNYTQTRLWLNSLENNNNCYYPCNNFNLTAKTNATGQNVYIYKNSVLLQSGLTTAEYISNLGDFSATVYNITAETKQTVSYNKSSVEYNLTVNKGSLYPELYINNSNLWKYIYPIYTNTSCNVTSFNDMASCILSRNNVIKGTSETVLLPPNIYYYKSNATDGNNNYTTNSTGQTRILEIKQITQPLNYTLLKNITLFNNTDQITSIFTTNDSVFILGVDNFYGQTRIFNFTLQGELGWIYNTSHIVQYSPLQYDNITNTLYYEYVSGQIGYLVRINATTLTQISSSQIDVGGQQSFPRPTTIDDDNNIWVLTYQHFSTYQIRKHTGSACQYNMGVNNYQSSNNKLAFNPVLKTILFVGYDANTEKFNLVELNKDCSLNKSITTDLPDDSDQPYISIVPYQDKFYVALHHGVWQSINVYDKDLNLVSEYTYNQTGLCRIVSVKGIVAKDKIYFNCINETDIPFIIGFNTNFIGQYLLNNSVINITGFGSFDLDYSEKNDLFYQIPYTYTKNGYLAIYNSSPIVTKGYIYPYVLINGTRTFTYPSNTWLNISCDYTSNPISTEPSCIISRDGVQKGTSETIQLPVGNYSIRANSSETPNFFANSSGENIILEILPFVNYTYLTIAENPSNCGIYTPSLGVHQYVSNQSVNISVMQICNFTYWLLNNGTNITNSQFTLKMDNDYTATAYYVGAVPQNQSTEVGGGVKTPYFFLDFFFSGYAIVGFFNIAIGGLAVYMTKNFYYGIGVFFLFFLVFLAGGLYPTILWAVVIFIVALIVTYIVSVIRK